MGKSKKCSLRNENEICDIQWSFKSVFMKVVSKNEKCEEQYKLKYSNKRILVDTDERYCK